MNVYNFLTFSNLCASCMTSYSCVCVLPVDMSLPPMTVVIARNEASCTS